MVGVGRGRAWAAAMARVQGSKIITGRARSNEGDVPRCMHLPGAPEARLHDGAEWGKLIRNRK